MIDARAVLLSHDQIQAIEHGARLLTTLAAIERAHMLDDAADLESILAGIDPVEVRLTANVLHSLTFLWHSLPPTRGGTDGAAQVDSGTATVSPLPLSVTAAQRPPDDDEQPSAPILPLHSYSTKAPCA